MTSLPSADQPQRQAALDPAGSFIVQAPAGSGKTELLTQRFLRLLSMVDRPERVLAITFTRKATLEMRERILLRLRQAGPDFPPPAADHERIAVEFAAAVRQKDQQLGWGLLRNPARLQIQTIDGLCARIAGLNPAPGEGISGLRVIEDAMPLYKKAARRLIADIGSSEAPDFAHAALTRLLVHLQGDTAALQRLLAEMLGRREQWLDLLQSGLANPQQVLENRQQVELDCVIDTLGSGPLSTLMDHLRSLARGVEDTELARRLIEALDELRQAPENTRSQVQAIHRTLLAVSTSTGDPFVARSVNSKVFAGGGSTGRETHVRAIQGVLNQWHESDLAKAVVKRYVTNPPLGLSLDQQGILDDCKALLQIADAELRLLFAEENKADFQYLAEMAMRALGQEEQPGDALLSEDLRLAHILMDEFQDTSHVQYKLLKRLTSGWQSGDGRSLFLVGDPMQSIYRFRKADVALFKQVFANRRLGSIVLKSLQLSSNFRSRKEIIQWVNSRFNDVFQAQIPVSPGAVAYVDVNAERDIGGEVVVHAWPLALGDQHEAMLVANLIGRAQQLHADTSIAVLGRGRKHLESIARELKERGVSYEAVEIEGLSTRPVISDLLTILRAILHPLDRVAWLALLRAPWVGLEPREMHDFARNEGRDDLLSLMLQADRLTALDDRTRARIRMVGVVMDDVIRARGRTPLHRLVEVAWIRLNGPYVIGSQPELDNAQGFFRLLADVEAGAPEDILQSLLDRMEKFYSASMASKVQLMTIHKAKGLEFDVVVLPGLHKKAGGNGSDFLRIEEIQSGDGSDGTLLAPLKGRDDDGPGLYGYLGLLKKEQELFEAQRVLYVAATRARESLHVLGAWKMVGPANNKAPGCEKNSFMQMLWPVFAQVVDPDINCPPAVVYQEPPVLPLLQLENPPGLAITPCFPELEPFRGEPRIPDRDSLALGEAVHLWLEILHDHVTGDGDCDDTGAYHDAWLAARRPALKASLVNAGAREQSIAKLGERLEQILSRVMGASAGREIVSPNGKPASWAELPFYTRKGVRLKKNIIDRIYQTEDGQYVIVDYKTGQDSQQARGKWNTQLDRYRAIVEACSGATVASQDIYLVETGQIVSPAPMQSR